MYALAGARGLLQDPARTPCVLVIEHNKCHHCKRDLPTLPNFCELLMQAGYDLTAFDKLPGPYGDLKPIGGQKLGCPLGYFQPPRPTAKKRDLRREKYCRRHRLGARQGIYHTHTHTLQW